MIVSFISQRNPSFDNKRNWKNCWCLKTVLKVGIKVEFKPERPTLLSAVYYRGSLTFSIFITLVISLYVYSFSLLCENKIK